MDVTWKIYVYLWLVSCGAPLPIPLSALRTKEATQANRFLEFLFVLIFTCVHSYLLSFLSRRMCDFFFFLLQKIIELGVDGNPQTPRLKPKGVIGRGEVASHADSRHAFLSHERERNA